MGPIPYGQNSLLSLLPPASRGVQQEPGPRIKVDGPGKRLAAPSVLGTREEGLEELELVGRGEAHWKPREEANTTSREHEETTGERHQKERSET